MSMIGIALSTYKEELQHIPKGMLHTRTILRFEERLRPFAEELGWRAKQYDHFDPAVQCHALPNEFYETCTFEELAKIWATHCIMFSHKMETLFNDSIQHCIIQRIRMSLHHWGFGDSRNEWNALVDLYNGIKNFSFELPDFEVRFGHPHHYWSRGVSPFDSEVFIDGSFAFFIHHRGLHVMTIGFSLAPGGRLLLSQVQLRKPKGNRFLYRLPRGHLEYAITLLRKYFPNLTLHLVDGASLVDRYISGYSANIEEIKSMRAPDLVCLKKNEDKLRLLQNGLGEYIRNIYRPLVYEKWKVSTYRPKEFNRISFHRIVRA